MNIIITEHTTKNNQPGFEVALCPEGIETASDAHCISARYERLIYSQTQPQRTLYRLTDIKPVNQTAWVQPKRFTQQDKWRTKWLFKDNIDPLSKQIESQILRPAQKAAQQMALGISLDTPNHLKSSFVPLLGPFDSDIDACLEDNLVARSALFFCHDNHIAGIDLSWQQSFVLPVMPLTEPNEQEPQTEKSLPDFGQPLKTVRFIVSHPDSIKNIAGLMNKTCP